MPREKRQLANRELFQQVNESIAELANRIDRGGETGFFCECSRPGCNTQIVVPLEVYAEVRKWPGTYLVLAGHEELSSEVAVGGYGRYVIVSTRFEEPA